MAVATTRTIESTSRHPVHVHGAEVSTDRDAILGYAEVLALLLALAVVLGAAWAVARPSDGADLRRPNTQGDRNAGRQFQAASTLRGRTNVLQPTPGGAESTSVPGVRGGAAELEVAAARVAARRAAVARASAARAAARAAAQAEAARAAEAARGAAAQPFYVDQYGVRQYY